MRYFIAIAAVFFAIDAARADSPASQPAAADIAIGKGKVVGLDTFFNHQVRDGVQFHYIWDDTKNSGYSRFGQVWEQFGATLAELPHAPSRGDLDQFSVYIIVNPSTEKSAADHQPHYIQSGDVDTIADWVKDGGVLALFANDKNNCEFAHYNTLAEKFGIHFNGDLRNTVPTHKGMRRGIFDILPDCPLFDGVKMIYMKEITTLTLKAPAEPLLIADKQDGVAGKDVIMATARYGKGFVFAVGDPWFYNEYIDVKTAELPIENRKAAENLAKWLLGAAAAREFSPSERENIRGGD
jgi:unsaturated rhamnogalacturonyl hydrolase